DARTGHLYALKKIRCPFGSDSVKAAMREVEMYKQFQHENIIKVIHVYDLNQNGNLQDAINNNLVHETHFNEKDMLKVFRGICRAVQVLHKYRIPNGPTAQCDDGVVPHAHRDIKPGNILLSDDMQTPILMDFGSLVRARIKIQNRTDALIQQDLASEHSTMPYRAPELLDVNTNTELNEKVDIWSLGCTLYAMSYGKSPFENSLNEQGGSITLAVLSNQFKFPSVDQDRYEDLISFMLKVDPKERPDIDQS
ncbi:3705_t:CDS:2, partial [Acaulospora colombiana]